MLTSPLLVSSHSPRKVNKHHACTSSTPYSLQFAGNVLSTVKILLDLHIKPCVVFMLVKPYILIRSCRCKEATLQTIDASSNCWPSVEGELTLDLTSGQNPRAKFKRSIIQAVGEVKFPEHQPPFLSVSWTLFMICFKQSSNVFQVQIWIITAILQCPSDICACRADWIISKRLL